jgi:hypothetical protein
MVTAGMLHSLGWTRDFGRAHQGYCNGRASCRFAQPIIKTVNLLSIVPSILNGFLTESEMLPQKNA